MSKFIRTENRIYQVESTLRDNGFVKGYNVGEMAFIRKDQVINQADTIEELCDEAVAVYPDGMHDNCSVMHIVDNNGFCEAVYGCLSVSIDDLKKDYECYEVYGAIWTDKGLIYVAKMNDKGELELI